MTMLAQILVAMVALLHLYFLVLEMFFWTKPLGRKVFGLDPAFAEASKVLAANQGLYNGFLAAGLIWGVCRADVPAQLFFLACVVVAGIYGAATVGKKILFVQALPAAVAAAVLLSA